MLLGIAGDYDDRKLRVVIDASLSNFQNHQRTTLKLTWFHTTTPHR